MIKRFCKRGRTNLVISSVVFILLNLAFFMIVFIAVARTGTGASVYEEAYAKQIALAIDVARPGTEIIIDISELFDVSKDKNIIPSIKIDCKTRTINVVATNSKGYNFKYYGKLASNSENSCQYVVDNKTKKVIIKT